MIELAFAGVIVLFSVLQYLTTRSNNASTSTQVGRLITAANQIQTAAGQFATSAGGIDSGVHDAVGKLNEQAAQMTNLAKAANRQSLIAKQAINANEKLADEDRRPWVSIANVVCTECSGKSDEIVDRLNHKITTTEWVSVGKLAAVVVNSGKTPAIDTVLQSTYTKVSWNDPVPTFDGVMARWDADWRAHTGKPAEHPKQVLTIAPSSLREYSLIDGTNIGNEFAGAGGHKLLYVVGKITYFDGKRQPHETTFCMFRHMGITKADFAFCSSGNDMH